MAMNCPDIIDLERFVQRDLDEGTRSSIDAHLSSCSTCGDEVKQLVENLRLASALRHRQPSADESAVNDFVPEKIGPYRILRKLGEGGMGTVYEAEQDSPRRVVAVKILRQGLVSASLLSRFR